MPTWLLKILGLNWQTTLAGLAAIVAAFGRIAIAWRTRDFGAIFTDGQLIFETMGTLLIGLGLISAKDRNVIGAGTMAKAVDSEGVVTNVEGVPVSQQPTTTPSVR